MAKGKGTKSPEERKLYNRQAREFGGDDTERQGKAETLEGSDQVSFAEDKDVEIKRPSAKSWFSKKWKNLLAGFITTILATVIGFLISWYVEIKIDTKYLERTVEENRSRIEKIESKGTEEYTVFVTKENLELRLQLIEKDLHAAIPDTADIEKRLAELEKTIEELQQTK